MVRLFAILVLILSTSPVYASLGQFLFESNRAFEAWRADLDKTTLTINDVTWQVYTRHVDARAMDANPCTVLLHGFTAEASHWFRFARQLNPSRCLVIPDLPGFGETSYSPEGRYGIALQALRVRDLLDALKPDSRWHVVGSSMGGHIAARFALDNPTRVASLTLFDAGGVEAAQKSPSSHIYETTGKPVFYVSERPAFYRLMGNNFNDAPWMPAPVLDYLADQFIARNERHMHIFKQIYGQDRLDARLHEIRVPTLIIWGADDKVLDPSMGQRYASLIEGSRYELLPGVGHLPFLEVPGVSASLVEAFWVAPDK